MTCAVCDRPNPLSLGACVRCVSTPGGSRVFVEAPDTAIKRTALAQLIRRLFPSLTAADAGRAAAGQKALVAVPRAVVPAMADALDTAGIQVRVEQGGVRFPSVPLGLRIVVAAAVGVGLLGGALANPVLLWTTPVVAALLLLLAEIELRRPVVGTIGSDAELLGSEAAAGKVTTRLARLPAGEARTLLMRLVSLARKVADRQRAIGDEGGSDELRSLVVVASEVAVELEGVDAALRIVEDAQAPDALKNRTTASTLRDASDQLSGGLRRAVELLADPRYGTSLGEEARVRLTSVTQGVGDHLAAWREAVAQVEETVGPID